MVLKKFFYKYFFLFKSLRTYVILLLVVITSSTPLYMQVFNISKRSELDNTLHNIELGLQMLENEIDIHNSILQRLILSKEY